MKKTLVQGQLGLLPLGLLIIVLNVVAMYYLDSQVSRIVRFVSSLFLVGVSIFKNGYRRNVLNIAIGALLIRDIAIVYNQIPNYRTLSLLCTILVYAVIGFFAFRRLREVKFNNAVIVLGIFMIALNIFNIFYFSESIRPALYNDAQYVLLSIQGALLVFMGFFAVLYNETFIGKQSLYILYCVMAFIFSDLCGLAAAMLEYGPARYADRAFYFVALCLLLDYKANFRPEADSISELDRR